MKIYLDDDSTNLVLVRRLEKAGHDVVTPSTVGLAGASDPDHFLYAIRNGLCILSANHDDFQTLHCIVQETGGQHPGMLIVRKDNDPTRDMREKHIVRAIAKLEASGMPIANGFHILNHWR